MRKYRIHFDYSYSELHGEGMMVNIRTSSCFKLNRIGALMLKQILHSADDEMAVTNLSKEIDATKDQLMIHYLQFRDELLKNGFIEEMEEKNEENPVG